MNNFKKFTPAFILVIVVFGFGLAGCGGSSSTVSGDLIPTSVNATIVADSVKIEKTAEGTNISYKTSVPVTKSCVVTSDFSFNNVPLWSEFHTAESTDKLNHTVKIAKTASAKNFMIFNSSADKYDNNGKGLKIE